MSDQPAVQPRTISGQVRVGHGQGGRTGARTANLDVSLAKGLAKGLYVGEVTLSGKVFCGLLYYGINSLTDADCLEIHVLDFKGDLYGKMISFVPTQYLRPPARFDSPELLWAQIAKDVAEARRLLGT